jgi:hypothetical protein
MNVEPDGSVPLGRRTRPTRLCRLIVRAELVAHPRLQRVGLRTHRRN